MNSGYQALLSRSLSERVAYAESIAQQYPEHYPLVLVPYEGTKQLSHPKYLVLRTGTLQHVTNEIIKGLGLISGQCAVYFYRYPLPFLDFCLTLVRDAHESIAVDSKIQDVYDKYHAPDNLLYLIYRVHE